VNHHHYRLFPENVFSLVPEQKEIKQQKEETESLQVFSL
jgi:hypothetical protein